MKKNQTKKISKNLVYVFVMLSIVVSSVLSIFSMRKNVMTSLSEENAEKIFSASSETIDKKEELNEDNKKFVEKISFIKQDETDNSGIVEKDKQKDLESKDKEESKESESNNKEESKKVELKGKEESKEVESKNNKGNSPSLKKEINNKIQDNKKENLEDLNYDDKEVFFQSKNSFIIPVVGEIEKDFSDDKLIYSKTLDEWRVHKGVDIIAKEGACVKAVLDGYVEDIKEDEEYGMSVSIRHSKNLVSVYKSLSCDVLVLPNQIIKQGDIIGFVSNTSKIENSMGSHLHFEIMDKNRLVDPKIYIQFKKK